MCGIAGIFHFRSRAPAAQAALERMAERLRHRGPDGEGIFRDGAVGLAHRRLSVIDPAGGAQPMASADGREVVVFNGEIFDYLELAAELRARGHVFRTGSDTEVLLAAYRAWGLAFPSRLNGMFAVALWDARARRLVLVRDRLGVKPLYYADVDDGWAFASEPKALRGLPNVDTSLDPDAIDEYMTLGYVVHPRTILAGIRKVEPGTLVVLEEGREPRVERWWRLRHAPEPDVPAEEWRGRIRAVFDDAVRLRLRSDVPLGVLLSGGVDSTAIAATAARAAGRTIDSFSVGVDVKGGVHELDAAAATAARLGTRHHELRLSPRAHYEALVEAARLLEEPLAEPMVGQLLALCRFVRNDVTVVLSGEGADEAFLGYGSYRIMRGIDALAQAPRRARERLRRAVERASAYVPIHPRWAKYARQLVEPLERRYLGVNYADPVLQQGVYSSEMRYLVRTHDPREVLRASYDEHAGLDPLARMGAVDTDAWLVDNTLLRSDFLSMAASVELRTPFLDYRMVELAARIPSSLKVRPWGQKVILKEALADRLPAEVRARKKLGFPTPLAELMRGDLGWEAEYVLLLAGAETREIFEPTELRRRFDEHREGIRDWSQLLFQVFMLELALRAGRRFDTEEVVRADVPRRSRITSSPPVPA